MKAYFSTYGHKGVVVKKKKKKNYYIRTHYSKFSRGIFSVYFDYIFLSIMSTDSERHSVWEDH